MNERSIIERPVIPDRIQVNITPKFNSIYDYYLEEKEFFIKMEFENYKDLIIKNCKLKKLETKKFRSKGKFKYMANIPSDIPYISDIKVSALPPFSISFKLNFIRLLREKIKQYPNFNNEYDKQIKLDEDNYISNKIWKNWDTNLISNLLNDLNEICLKIADKSMYYIIPYHSIQYENVTINQIETNIDYNVGTQKSLYFMNKISEFINTDKGTEFRKNIGEIALKHRIPYNLTSDLTTIEKNETVSIQFQICKGLKAKIYRKTKDDIRFELTFKKTYLKRKFRKINEKKSTSTNIKRIAKPVIEFSKDFFKEVDLISYLKEIEKSEKYNLVFYQLNPVYEHFRQTQPEINDIIDCLVNKKPITDKNTIKYIKNHPQHSKRFRRETNEYGHKFLISDYKKLDKPRIKKLKPAFKTKLAPRKPKPTLSPKEILWKNDKMYIEKWSKI